MAKRGTSISVKMIVVSTLLLIVVIGLFGGMNSMQSQRLITDAAERLNNRITESMQLAGTAQLRLLAEAVRIAMLQNDYTTLQTVVFNIGRNDGRVSTAAVVDSTGTILAHSDRVFLGKQAEGSLKESLSSAGMTIQRGALADGHLSMTFALPVKQDGVRLSTVFIAYSLKPLQAELQKAKERAQTEVGASIRNTIVVGILSVLVGVLLTIFQGLRISRPIRALALQADQIASGDLEARVSITSNDEIGFLGTRFNFMAEQVRLLMQETMEKAAMQKELEVASAIQSTLVPDNATVHLPGIDLAGYYRPATQCGGDWWSYYQLAGDRSLVIIGDVTGHGVGSAMITAAAKGAATTIMALTEGTLELTPMLQAMNVAIHDAARGKFVMTCFASIYEPATRTLTYANAGHNFPFHYSAATTRLRSLVIRGNRLGDIHGSQFEVRQLQLEVGDSLIWFTDGIIECEGPNGEEYGDRRFRTAIRQAAELAPDEGRDEIVRRANEFYGDMPAKDDITLVFGKVT